MTKTQETLHADKPADPSDVVREFFGRWSRSKSSGMSAFDDFFTPETVWENVGLATTVGIKDAQAFAQDLPPGYETMVAEIKFLAVTEQFVFTERVDDFYNAAGELIVSARGAGVAEVRDGRIVAMREYFPAAAETPEADAPTDHPPTG